MATLASILAAIVAIFTAIPILAKYMPAKTSQEKEDEAKKQYADKSQKEKDTGRPIW